MAQVMPTVRSRDDVEHALLKDMGAPVIQASQDEAYSSPLPVESGRQPAPSLRDSVADQGGWNGPLLPRVIERAQAVSLCVRNLGLTRSPAWPVRPWRGFRSAVGQ